MATSTVQIAAAPERVFEYLSDLAKHGEWTADPAAIVAQDGSPVAPGKRYVSNATFMGRAVQDQLEVTVVEPPKRFGFVARGPQAVVDHVFTLRRGMDGTHVERVSTVLQMPLWLKLAFPLLYLLVGKKSDAASLGQLKSRIEAAGGAG
jgi:uncharacterized protein YndB with AHSA1/START domain